jgi:hypothetical protein
VGTPTWTSPLHYDSGGATYPGIHADFNFNPGVGQVHTILSIVVTRDAASPYDRVRITRGIDHTNWVSPIIPVGSGTVTQGQANANGFTVMEDINGITALSIGSPT